jgi:hypothetical protein
MRFTGGWERHDADGGRSRPWKRFSGGCDQSSGILLRINLHHLVPPDPLGPSRRMSQDALRVSSNPAKDRSTARKLSKSGTTYEARVGPGPM